MQKKKFLKITSKFREEKNYNHKGNIKKKYVSNVKETNKCESFSF